MKKRFSEEQIIGILKEQEAGQRTADVYRRLWRYDEAIGMPCTRNLGSDDQTQNTAD